MWWTHAHIGPAGVVAARDFVTMPSHFIRFRKAWRLQDMQSPERPLAWLDLPLASLFDPPLPSRIRLIRTFSPPTLPTGRESLAIRLERVGGLRSVSLNDELMPVPDPLPDPFEIAIVEPRARNRLVLEVDVDRAKRHGSPDSEGWGMIALIVRESE